MVVFDMLKSSNRRYTQVGFYLECFHRITTCSNKMFFNRLLIIAGMRAPGSEIRTHRYMSIIIRKERSKRPVYIQCESLNNSSAEDIFTQNLLSYENENI